MWGGTDVAQSVAAIQAAIDAGINLFDTAPIYGFGLSEEIIGRAIKGRRDRVLIATKCGLIWDEPNGEFFFEEEGHRVYRYLHPESIRRELEQSLRRLQTEYIDLYQTHWQDPTTPIEDTMAELLKLKDEGKIRAIGVSNVTLNELKRYLAVGPIDTDQERYSLLDREHEYDLLPFCRQHGIAFLAYSPLAWGLLTGHVTPDRKFPPGDLRNESPRFSRTFRQQVMNFLRELDPLRENYSATYSQLVLAWTIAQPGVTHALTGIRRPEQAYENAKAADIQLTEADLKLIEETRQKHFREIPPDWPED